MRIAVTGATGSIGGQVVRPLAATGEHEVVALTRRQPAQLPDSVTAARADYADLE